MNNSQEAQMLIKFRSEGKKLVHLCPDWDFMAIHADTDEIAACCCDFETEADNLFRDQRSIEIAFRKEGWQKQVNDLLREMRDRIEGSK